MSVSQTNVLTSVTANVVQGLARTNHFTGLQLAPGIGQDGQSVNWPLVEIDDGEMLRNNMAARAFGTGFKQMVAKIGLNTSTLSGDGLEIAIDKSVATDQSKRGLQILELYARELMFNAYRMDENDTATLAQGSGFDTANSVVAYTNANIATIDFQQDLVEAIERVAGRGEVADTVIIPIGVWNRIRFATKLQKYVKGDNNPSAFTVSDLQRAFEEDGIKKVLIGRARENTAAKNKVSISTIWDNDHIWVGATGESENGVANSLGSAMATFYSDETPSPYFVETYYSDEKRSDVLRVYGETNKKIINSRAGTRITTQYA